MSRRIVLATRKRPKRRTSDHAINLAHGTAFIEDLNRFTRGNPKNLTSAKIKKYFSEHPQTEPYELIKIMARFLGPESCKKLLKPARELGLDAKKTQRILVEFMERRKQGGRGRT